MPQATTILSYGDKKTLLAAALGIREWNITNDGLTDNDVVYELSDTTTNYKGLYKRSYTIGENNKVTLGTPSQVFRRTSYEPLVVVGLFSMDDSEVCFASDGTVLRTGKIFEAGDYPDKGFSITEEQLARVPATFTPVNNDLEHKPTILSGKIGQLRSVVAKGKELFGTVAIPKWLNDTIGKDPLKVSLAWTKDSKQIIGNALVLNPRIPDAQLMAAFSAANTTIPKGGTSMKVKAQEAIDRVKAFFSKSGTPEELKDVDLDNVDFSNEEAAAPAPAASTQVAPATAPANFSADLQARDTRIAKLENELAAKDAAEFADNAIKTGKAFPSERESLVAMYAQARKDDGDGLACFAADGTTPTTRVAALTSAVNARPSHNLTAEQIAGIDPKNPLVVLGNTTQFTDDAERPTPDGQKITPERAQRLAQFSNIQEVK
ncbi:MAG: hypothetical protein ABFD54_11395 [Armatimonadota bacterium]